MAHYDGNAWSLYVNLHRTCMVAGLRRLLGWAKMGWFHKNAQKCAAAISNVAVEMGNINIYQILVRFTE